MKKLFLVGLGLALAASVLIAQGGRQDSRKSGPGPALDNIYTGDFMQFGITNEYGEIMPYQCPIGIEHLMVGGYYCGYTLSYLTGTGEYLAFSVYDDRYHMNVGSYEEVIGPRKFESER